MAEHDVCTQEAGLCEVLQALPECFAQVWVAVGFPVVPAGGLLCSLGQAFPLHGGGQR